MYRILGGEKRSHCFCSIENPQGGLFMKIRGCVGG